MCCTVVSSCQTKKSIPSANTNDELYIIKGDFTILETDNLGYIYVVTANNELRQYDKNYKLLYEFSVNTLGEISSIDVSNPQKILVYYPDFQFIVFVDNTLSEIKRLNLESLGFWDIQGVALSNDNLIWIYDPVNYRLIKIEESGKVRLSSNESYFGELDDVFSPQVNAEDNNVYLYSHAELMLFDIFGQHLKTMQLPNEKIQFFENQLIVLDNQKLKIIQLKLEAFDEADNTFLNLTDMGILDFSIHENSTFLLDGNGVFNRKRIYK